MVQSIKAEIELSFVIAVTIDKNVQFFKNKIFCAGSWKHVYTVS
jgi:hypothetical protein